MSLIVCQMLRVLIPNNKGVIMRVIPVVMPVVLRFDAAGRLVVVSRARRKSGFLRLGVGLWMSGALRFA